MENNQPDHVNETFPATMAAEENLLEDRRETFISASPRTVFQNFASLGGHRGWLYFDWAWKLHGWFDNLIGGVGMREGGRDSMDLNQDDILDFWRVEEVIPDRLLRLRAEMLVPGKAWLQFEAIPLDNGQTKLEQNAYFIPDGLGGIIYWYGLYPIHTLIFTGLVKRIAQTSISQE